MPSNKIARILAGLETLRRYIADAQDIKIATNPIPYNSLRIIRDLFAILDRYSVLFVNKETSKSDENNFLADIKKCITDPISLQIMLHPVLDLCGCVFERQEIVRWMNTNPNCPNTRQSLTEQGLREFSILQHFIAEVLYACPELWAELPAVESRSIIEKLQLLPAEWLKLLKKVANHDDSVCEAVGTRCVDDLLAKGPLPVETITNIIRAALGWRITLFNGFIIKLMLKIGLKSEDEKHRFVQEILHVAITTGDVKLLHGCLHLGVSYLGPNFKYLRANVSELDADGTPWSHRLLTQPELFKAWLGHNDVDLEDLNALDAAGDTMVHKLVRERQVELLKLMLDKGANVMLANGQGRKPLQLVLDSGDFPVEVLERLGLGRTQSFPSSPSLFFNAIHAVRGPDMPTVPCQNLHVLL